MILAVPQGVALGSPLPALAILGACLAWGIVALNDASWIAAVKGLVAGPVNLTLAFALGAQLPPPGNVAAAMVVGFFAYGVSLVLFVVGLGHLGTARAGAYFSVAPFFGALLAVILGEPVTLPLVAAAILMALGVSLHLRETHGHLHTHEVLTHDHWHTHGQHHRHPHDTPVPSGARHRHRHTHQPITHAHQHFPDSHHRHSHPAHEPTSPTA